MCHKWYKYENGIGPPQKWCRDSCTFCTNGFHSLPQESSSSSGAAGSSAGGDGAAGSAGSAGAAGSSAGGDGAADRSSVDEIIELASQSLVQYLIRQNADKHELLEALRRLHPDKWKNEKVKPLFQAITQKINARREELE